MVAITPKQYLEENGLLIYLQGGKGGQMEPNYADLARLHSLVTARKAFCVLEFGVGWSTVILADALRKNKTAWEGAGEKPAIRNSAPFRVFAVDSSQEWIGNAKHLIPSALAAHVELRYSAVQAGTFNGCMCHFYESLPDVVPDFLYVDGPDPATVEGSVRGLSWKNPERTVMAADLLAMEPTLLPGAFVVIDGRVNNARFLENNLQRKWRIERDEEEDVTTMELREQPLGKLNREILRYCLRDDAYGKNPQ